MRMHGIVFWILGVMQWYWYSNDRRRERFVSICRDRDVQRLTWDAYMNKELVRAKPNSAAEFICIGIARASSLKLPRESPGCMPATAARKGLEQGLQKVEVYVKGPGSGRETAIRSLQAAGLEVSGVKDVTPQAHNGCRPRKRRRV